MRWVYTVDKGDGQPLGKGIPCTRIRNRLWIEVASQWQTPELAAERLKRQRVGKQDRAKAMKIIVRGSHGQEKFGSREI